MISMADKLTKFFNDFKDSEPNAKIKIGSGEWKSDKIEISYVSISSSIGPEAGTCSVELTQPHEKIERDRKGRIKLDSDYAKIKAGEKLEVSLGYDNKLEPVFTGYISAFDVEYDSNQNVRFVIQGMDAKMWMMINKKTELKKDKKKYSEIVKAICGDYSTKLNNNKIDISSEAAFEKEIYQRNESDFEFLSRISNLTGTLFFIDRTGKFYFISPSAKKNSRVSIEASGGVEHIRASVSVWGIPKSVEVASINSDDYQKVVTGKATTSDKVGEGDEATKLTKNINNKNIIRIVDNTVQSAKEAKFLAESVYNRRNLGLAKLTAKIIGYPKVDLAAEIKIDGFDNPVDNKYIAVGIEHEYSSNPRRYNTILTLKANRVTPKKKF